jgi:hypothetical protein
MSSAGGRSPRRRSWRPNPDTALALVALVLAAGGGGYALGAGTGDQVITACFDPASGSVPQKIIAGTDCGPGQSALSWNQIGPLGPTGSQGPAGPAGAGGPAGAAAPVDRTIVAAIDGSTGPPGQPGSFVVNLELSPGTYELDGTVGFGGFKGVVGCRITRDRPAQILDTLVVPVTPASGYGGPAQPVKLLTQVDFRSLVEHALVTVAAPASPDPGSTKVNVAFSCSAPPAFYKRRSTKRRDSTTFYGPALSATPVTITRVQKAR